MINQAFNNEDSYNGDPLGLAKIVKLTSDLVTKKKVIVRTKESYKVWMTKIVFDNRENIFRLKGDFLSDTCQYQAPSHSKIVHSVVLSAAVHLLRLSLVNGGNGTVIPMLLRIDDPVNEKYEFF